MAGYGAKSATSQDESDEVDRVLAALDFAGWAVLAGEVDDIFADVAKDGGNAALVQIGIDVQADPEIMNIVSADAIAYAQKRSAELVGMRRDELGRLVPNPNAKWRIYESTRDYMRSDVTEALQKGWSNDQLAAKFADAYGFSADRAMLIARTETQMAGNAAQLAGYKASGVVDGKQWLTAEDDKVEEDCEANGASGPTQALEFFAEARSRRASR